MIQVVKDGGIEQFERPMPSQYWLRNKKQTIQYVYDTPFATTRQLEDQRLLQQLNRNPQLNTLTKVDKVRSHTISQSHAASRPVAVKANVVNKIVREASGIHNYTIVAPPRSLDDGSVKKVEKLEPELNPRVRPYAQEAKLKPILCSFGHRPRSASRTFHPATMKFRLKHGEIAKGGDNIHKTGFGLPVAVLAQVLKAPHIPSAGHSDFISSMDNHGDDEDDDIPIDEGEDEEEEPMEGTENTVNHQQENYNDLFLSETDQQKLFRNVKKGEGKQKKKHRRRAQSPNASLAESNLEKPSWISSVERRKDKKGGGGASPSKPGSPSGASASQPGPISPSYAIFNNSTIEYPDFQPLSPQLDDRPAWDQAHHRVSHGANHIFQLRSSGLNKGGFAMPLADRLRRFSKLSVAEVQPVLFCTEKQETDKRIMAGESVIVPKSVAVKGQNLFKDPNDVEVEIVKYYRKQTLKEEARKQKAKAYQDLLRTIPKVDYYPTSILRDMRTRENSTAGSVNSHMSASLSSSGAGGRELPPPGARAGSLFSDGAMAGDQEDGLDTPFGDFAGSLTHSIASSAGGRSTGSHKFLLPPVDTTILQQKEGAWQELEADRERVMSAAKLGDERALYEFNMLDKRPVLTPLGPPTRTYAALAAATETNKPLT